jgi:hypothetical protein
VSRDVGRQVVEGVVALASLLAASERVVEAASRGLARPAPVPAPAPETEPAPARRRAELAATSEGISIRLPTRRGTAAYAWTWEELVAELDDAALAALESALDRAYPEPEEPEEPEEP